MSTYYITFGSNPEFPYPNRYMTVKADSEAIARDAFGQVHPNKEGSDCLNFSFIYEESDFDECIAPYYHDGPAEIMEVGEKLGEGYKIQIKDGEDIEPEAER